MGWTNEHDSGYSIPQCLILLKDNCMQIADDSVTILLFAQLLLFLKGFTESERNKLAMLTGILLANGNISASILSSLFNENLVKEGKGHVCRAERMWVGLSSSSQHSSV